MWMSTYILMKILESAPDRYDRGIRLLTLGRLDKVYDSLISKIKTGDKVLDIGCGTGALTIRAALKGAIVKGIDINAQMLEVAQKKVKEAQLEDKVELVEMGVVELIEEDPESYDIVTSGLCFSELSDDELTYTLKEIKRILKPGGLLLIADEIESKSILKKWLNKILRLPLVIITYIVTQATTRAVSNLKEKIEKSGLQIELFKTNSLENFLEVIARKEKV